MSGCRTTPRAEEDLIEGARWIRADNPQAARRFLDAAFDAFDRLTEFPESVIRLIDVLQLSIGELDRGVGMLRDINKKNELQRVFQKVNDYENVADDVFDNAVAELFDKEKDAIRIIKIKEILVGLETATDKCEDAANVLEGIYIKNA